MKKEIQAITDMEVDFTQWYTDIVKKADLADYSTVKGCVILRPYGYAIWELIKAELDRRFKDTGHENVYMPMFIPESLLQKEKDHVEGFAPEVAWVTHGGATRLTEKLCVRPTSETLFCEHYASIIQSYRDLPKLYNQWCSVVRWEKTTRPFLRTTEFLWQEGHTAHATREEATEETIRMLNVYIDVCKNALSIPVISGQKTEKEKFAGAVDTYTIESLMKNGYALQSGTSHYFGDGFAKAFDITFTDENNKLQYVHQTSWGMSTRIIGALIMVHGDNSGLVLPPAVAPIQVVVVPIASHKEGVAEKAAELANRLKSVARVKIDDSDKKPGWKFSEYEMKGVPIRLEIGPRDIEENTVVLARRDNGEKITVPMDALEAKVTELLEDISKNLYESAQKNLAEKTYTARDLDEYAEIAASKNGFIKAMWCGDEACEISLKEKFATTSRCMPFCGEKIGDTCVCCKKPAQKLVYWGKAY
ncbi:proline--tRNA ligase 2 [Clostridia bacterium]|nr:proline--tRNA ligase 2 [Clostridia bacterium]